MASEHPLPPGLYEQPIDEEMAEVLKNYPELLKTFEKIEDESAPHTYSQFLFLILKQALPILASAKRVEVLNRLIELLSAEDGLEYTKRKKLLHIDAPHILKEIRVDESFAALPRPESSLRMSSLFTGSREEPQLESELRTEMKSADQVDILVSFIKWSGLRLLQPAFENLVDRKIPVRIITTSYMGASDPEAIEWLAKKQGIQVKVSYDTERTRLHAKAYHFVRKSGFSTAYIGSANMSGAAMTSGLEWTVKITSQDMGHIMSKFFAEFETYWAREEFVLYDWQDPDLFRRAITRARNKDKGMERMFFADIRPYVFQERILEALTAARDAGSFKNLVIAATGTGKTVIAAFDYARFCQKNGRDSRLLFVAHNKEILYQARCCFRSVLRDQNFGEMLVDGEVPKEWDYVFASIQSLESRKLWERWGGKHYRFLILDEAHHASASSYRPLFDYFQPEILLGLTATPERMDGESILGDFDHRFAAEIRLPEALEEKLLCPFHYFGISDSVDISGEEFWLNGKYDINALTKVYTGDHLRALERVDLILDSMHRYQPNLEEVRAVGFCVSVAHAEFMAEKFRQAGYCAEVILGKTPGADRNQRIQEFRSGNISFLFTVDVFSEGVDVPEINMVLFLRPTESLTVFLQQLGRGLRHAPEKECLTVLDFVGQSHPKYRLDRKFSALLRNQRQRIDQEVERDFPSLPPGCNILLERVARERILQNIRQSLGNLKNFIPEAIRTFTSGTGRPLSFASFVEETKLAPLEILRTRTWSEWKSVALNQSLPEDPDIQDKRKALRRICLRTDQRLLKQMADLSCLKPEEPWDAEKYSEEEKAALHYVLWGKKGEACSVKTYEESIAQLRTNPSVMEDLGEIVEWRQSVQAYPQSRLELPGNIALNLHGAYGLFEINAAFGLATIQSPGPSGTGVIHLREQSIYIHLVTFKKEKKDFAPTTRYKDYLISRTRLHWESQSSITQASSTGRNYIHFKERGYTILFFARAEKRTEGETAPFIFLGPVKDLIHYENDRPISMIWELEHPVPAALLEETRVG